MTIYRIKLFTSGFHKDDNDQQYCIDNNIVAVGWGSETVKDFAEYVNDFEQKFLGKKKTSSEYQSIKNMRDMQVGDFVWTQISGRRFLLGKIKSEPFLDDNRRQIGPTRKCNWKEINFNDIPGKVISNFVGRGRTLQKINLNDEYIKYCQCLYEGNLKEYVIKDYKQLLHYDDLEDLVGLYLQYKENYYIIPSTNKQSTKLVEYELRNAKGERACVQCKIGESIVDENEIAQEFKNYKIYIATINNYKNYEGKNIEKIDIEVLWNWAKNNINLLPDRIKNYIKISN